MSDPYIGEIRQFAGTFAPNGWAFCNGQPLSIADYDTLFNLIGTTYGGDGITYFNVPDLQGRVAIHMGNGYPLSAASGSETVTLTQNQLPTHSHTPLAASVGGSDNPTNNVWGSLTSAKPYGPSPGNATMNPASISATGGNQPHDNMVPFVAVYYIISLYGIYPSPS